MAARMDIMSGRLKSINISEKRGVQKKPVESAHLVFAKGIKDDAHFAPKDETRQVSLLAIESVQKQQKKLDDNETGVILKDGAFGENLTTEGVPITDLKLGDKIFIGEEVILEVSRLGKICHDKCAIYHLTGDCIMPREGIFGRVLQSGTIKVNDKITIERKSDD